MPELDASLLSGRAFVRTEGDFVSLYFAPGSVQSRMSITRPFALELPYTRTMMAFLLAQGNPQHILMVGLGGGSLAKFCHRHLPEARITVVEIDPDVIALRQDFQVPEDSARFTVVCADAADYLRQTTLVFDAILVDGFDVHGQAAALTGRRFFEDCFRALCPQGILVTNLDADHPAHAVFVDRVEQVFAGHVLGMDVPERSNHVLFAGKDLALSSRCMSLSQALGRRSVDAQTQLKTEFQRILAILDGREPLLVGPTTPRSPLLLV